MQLTPKRLAAGVAALVVLGALGLVVLASGLDWLARDRAGEVRPGGPGRAGAPEEEPLPPDDQTRQVQRLIDAKCREGGEVTLSGVYKTARAVSIEGCRDLVVKGPATLDGSAPGRPRDARHISIRNSRDVVVEEITVVGGRCRRPCPDDGDGGMRANERQHGFEVAASERVELRKVVARDVWGDGVYVTAKTFGGDEPERTPVGITVKDSYIENSGRQGIAVAGVDQMIVERTVVYLANRTVFDFEAESGGASNFIVRDSHIVAPDNGTLNISCKKGADGRMLNVGPFVMMGNRVYGDSLKVNPFNCELPAGLVVLKENEGSLPLDAAPVRP